MSKRLAMLEGMIAKGTKDPFHWYALAMEYAGQERVRDAISTFEKLREIEPTYVPMYLMAGQILVKASLPEEGRVWLEEGVTRARAKGDAHALSELQSALAGLE